MRLVLILLGLRPLRSARLEQHLRRRQVAAGEQVVGRVAPAEAAVHAPVRAEARHGGPLIPRLPLKACRRTRNKAHC